MSDSKASFILKYAHIGPLGLGWCTEDPKRYLESNSFPLEVCVEVMNRCMQATPQPRLWRKVYAELLVRLRSPNRC